MWSLSHWVQHPRIPLYQTLGPWNLGYNFKCYLFFRINEPVSEPMSSQGARIDRCFMGEKTFPRWNWRCTVTEIHLRGVTSNFGKLEVDQASGFSKRRFTPRPFVKVCAHISSFVGGLLMGISTCVRLLRTDLLDICVRKYTRIRIHIYTHIRAHICVYISIYVYEGRVNTCLQI